MCHWEWTVIQREENVIQRSCPSDSKNSSWVYENNMYVALDVLVLLPKCCNWGFWLPSTLKTNYLLALNFVLYWFRVWSGCKRAEFLFILNKLSYSESSEVASYSCCIIKSSNPNVLICMSATTLFFKSFFYRYFLEDHESQRALGGEEHFIFIRLVLKYMMHS